jgi:inward rectifier potassium channel
MATTPPQPSYRFEVVGAGRTPLKDAYHAFLRIPWWYAIGLIVVAYLALNALFALLYLAAGGVHGARPGSFYDAYCFSVQTMGTIGYGAMFPTSGGANAVVIAESVAGLLVTALATGLVFAKFARTTSRMVFSHQAVISPVDGVPTLMIRLGNERGNRIMDSHIRVTLSRTEHTLEGTKLFRMYDLPLVRERMPVLTRSWTTMHKIGPGSPLHGRTPEDLKADEVELMVTLIGLDDTSMQTVHALHQYMDSDIVWGARHADILSEPAPDLLLVDLRKFHDLVPTKPTEDFPYPPPG